MPARLDAATRFGRALDAVGLTKLLGAAAMYFVWRGSPMYALGVVLAMPIVAAVSVLIARLVYGAATGRAVGRGALDPAYRFPPARLGTSGDRTFHEDVTPIRYRHVRSPSREWSSALHRGNR